MKCSIFIFFIGTVFFVSPDLSEIRKNYPLANDSKEVTKKMHEAFSTISEDDGAILVAYKGGVSTLMAKHADGVKNKKAFFQEGATLLELAVEQDSNNIEIRCIRLGVQENSPKFLKYKDAIETDKQFILDHFSSENSREIKDFVKGYVQQSSVFSPEERQLF